VKDATVAAGLPAGETADLLEVDEDFTEYAYRHGWTDGLPVVEPTPERVAAMLEHARRGPLETIAVLPPGQGVATVEAIATNAVMAGCKPEHLPVVLAAVRAVAEPSFNIYGMQATTNPVTPALMINGPLARELDFNGGANCFGQGNQSNAVVGRALRFCLLNIGYGTPGELDMATQGQPGKYTFCFAENEDANPWEPHHVERGFARESSCVTAFQAAMLVNILDFGSKTAESLLTSIADAMASTNTNNMQLAGGDLALVLCPEHAEILGREGLSKDDVRRFLFQNARVPASRFSEGLLLCVKDWRNENYKMIKPDTQIPVVDDYRHIQIAVAGGAGSQSAYIPGFGDGWSQSVEI